MQKKYRVILKNPYIEKGTEIAEDKVGLLWHYGKHTLISNLIDYGLIEEVNCKQKEIDEYLNQISEHIKSKQFPPLFISRIELKGLIFELIYTKNGFVLQIANQEKEWYYLDYLASNGIQIRSETTPGICVRRNNEIATLHLRGIDKTTNSFFMSYKTNDKEKIKQEFLRLVEAIKECEVELYGLEYD